MRNVQIIAARVVADQIDRVIAAAGVVAAHALSGRQCYRHLPGQALSHGRDGGNFSERCPEMPSGTKPKSLLMHQWRNPGGCGLSGLTAFHGGISGGC